MHYKYHKSCFSHVSHWLVSELVDFSDEHIAFFCTSPFFVTALGKKKKVLFLCATEESHTGLVQHDDINDMHDDRMYFFLWVNYPFNS